MAVLARQGIRPIDAAGKPFDPRYHEAVQEVEEPSREPGTVVEVIEDGYTIHDRLLRPARVVVAKRPGEGSVSGRETARGPVVDPRARA